MLARLRLLLSTYLYFVVIFVLFKPIFMLINLWIYPDVKLKDVGDVILHGLPMDLSMAGYLTIIPALLIAASTRVYYWHSRPVWKVYLGLTSFLMGLCLFLNAFLYGYWQFPLDATPFFYFFSSPGDALASQEWWITFTECGYVLMSTIVFYLVGHWLLIRQQDELDPELHPLAKGIVLLLVSGLLFLPIRGGLTVSTMNTGRAYYCDVPYLNHAAVNPMFSVMESWLKSDDFGSQYQFLDDSTLESRLFPLYDARLRKELIPNFPIPVYPDSMELEKKDVDVMFIILESFSAHLLPSLGGEEGIAPCLDSIARQGVLFSNFYANSFRTDRGLVSILSGFPAMPTASLMKYPSKTAHMPSIASHLSEKDYDCHYYYGGDADFCNMRSYLRSSGFTDIVCDIDFPRKDRTGKWGAHDHLVFRRLLSDLEHDSLPDRRTFRVLQTSSSHEPFEVPYHRLDNPRANAFAYTDSCLGDFMRRFRQLPQWENTLVVIVPDHQGAYPEGLANEDPARYHIPLIFTGGVIKQPWVCDRYGSQHDIAATVLNLLDISYRDFEFSKDLFCDSNLGFAFFTYPGLMGITMQGSSMVYDLEGKRIVHLGIEGDEECLPFAQAYLQEIYRAAEYF